ncbi:hypothetical protein [Microaceticoccus formicicus]|uniref:hypothetical protein n=1 Tax=Microaceticoccus formicicus TaxID=3118105 RepID=UPI003CD04333|nr:hypothetical protein VZL98_04935 [Peptoniphilaceae bacterium AMB_02]
MKKVIFLCGLIGAGKTTYALSNYDYVTDMDCLPEFSRKEDQIRWTMNLLREHDVVCHITCLPTKEELHAFRGIESEIHWIKASLNQAKTNILIRNRQRDMENLQRVFDANEKYFKRAVGTQRKMKIINVYGAEE